MDKLKEIAWSFQEHGIESYYVGGAVRDEIMGITPDDHDICLVGVKNWKMVKEILMPHCDTVIAAVGKNFPTWVAMIDGVKYDYALARTEKKVGETRQDYLCNTENVTIEEDLKRRDLTINAIAKNVLTDEIIDPYKGALHIKLKKAHPVSEAFDEDALRVIRAARFIARFELTPSVDLVLRCYKLTNEHISAERVGDELRKLFKQAKKPSIFFNFLREVCWLGYYFPELEALIDVPQSPKHHPEGCAYTHTMHCIDATQDPFIRAVMLCHDLGKAEKTTIDGIPWKKHIWDESSFHNSQVKIQSIGHEEAGVQLTKDMLKRISYASHENINKIAVLVELHMIRIYGDNPDTKIVRRTLRKLIHYEVTYDQLFDVVYADLAGRPPLSVPQPLNIGQEHARELLINNEMTPVVTGKMLRRNGIKPGPEMGDMIKKGLEFQDRGILNASNWRARLKGYGFKCLQTETPTAD